MVLRLFRRNTFLSLVYHKLDVRKITVNVSIYDFLSTI